MPKLPRPETIAAALTATERVLLFCVASNTDWAKAGITGATAQHLHVRGLIEPKRTPVRFVLTEQGRKVLAALLRDEPEI